MGAIFGIGGELGVIRIETDEANLAQCADSQPCCGFQPPGKNSAALCGPAWHGLPLSPTPGSIVCRHNMDLPLTPPISVLLTSAPFSVTVGLCFSMISRLIGAEMSSRNGCAGMMDYLSVPVTFQLQHYGLVPFHSK